MRGARWWRLAAVAVAVLAGACAAPVEARPKDWADVLLFEQRAGSPIPVLSWYEPELDLDYAYAVQRAYLEKARSPRADERLMGLVAGPNDRFMRMQLGLGPTTPLLGGWLRSWQRPSGAYVPLKPYVRPVLGNAFGFVLSRPVAHRLTDVTALKAYVEAVVPVVVLSDIAFGNEARAGEVDHIAANLGLRLVLVGEPQPGATDVNALLATLAHGERGLNAALGSAAGGDQWRALLALVNEAVARGATLERGQLLITGAIGRLVPAEPGEWRADYQGAGSIRFTLR